MKREYKKSLKHTNPLTIVKHQCVKLNIEI